MNNTTILKETRRELKKQCLLGTALFCMTGYAIPYDTGVKSHWVLFWSILVSIVLTGLLLIYVARRGLWVSIYRAMCLFAGLGSASVAGLYFSLGLSDKVDSYRPDADPIAIFVILAMVFAAVIIYFFLWIRPYWRDTYDMNVRRQKIDLGNGRYSVTTQWATRRTKSAATNALISAAIPFGAGLGVLLARSDEPQFLFLMVPSLFILWLAFSMSSIEIYNAVQLRKIERKIGRPLIIDAYA